MIPEAIFPRKNKNFMKPDKFLCLSVWFILRSEISVLSVPWIFAASHKLRADEGASNDESVSYKIV